MFNMFNISIVLYDGDENTDRQTELLLKSNYLHPVYIGYFAYFAYLYFHVTLALSLNRQ